MSAFTRIADLNQTSRHVSFVPESDLSRCSNCSRAGRPMATSIIVVRTPGTNADSLEQRQHSGSGIDPINRTEKIHLADVDTIVAEDGVRYRNVEVDVRDCHLQEVVLSAEVLAGRP